jgi:predicted lipid-binding transport protein (Tim44 family)
MNIDTIIYAIVAVVLLARLWSVFGQRNDEDQQRPNPYVPPPRSKDDKNTMRDSSTPLNEIPLLLRPQQAAPASLAGGLEKIKELDPSFEEKQFLYGARAAFTIIVQDFAKGDTTRMTKLLAQPVLTRFQEGIDNRRKNGQTMESKITSIRDVEVTAARVEGTQAIVDVQFVSEQENTLRDSTGHVIGGEIGKIEQITDVWVFARDTKSTDPNWLLIETKS